MAKTYIAAGWGFNVGANFDRAIVDIPCELAPGEYAGPAGNVIAYIAGDPESRVSFLRGSGRIRVCVPRRAIVTHD